MQVRGRSLVAFATDVVSVKHVLSRAGMKNILHGSGKWQGCAGARVWSKREHCGSLWAMGSTAHMN